MTNPALDPRVRGRVSPRILAGLVGGAAGIGVVSLWSPGAGVANAAQLVGILALCLSILYGIRERQEQAAGDLVLRCDLYLHELRASIGRLSLHQQTVQSQRLQVEGRPFEWNQRWYEQTAVPGSVADASRAEMSQILVTDELLNRPVVEFHAAIEGLRTEYEVIIGCIEAFTRMSRRWQRMSKAADHELPDIPIRPALDVLHAGYSLLYFHSFQQVVDQALNATHNRAERSNLRRDFRGSASDLLEVQQIFPFYTSAASVVERDIASDDIGEIEADSDHSICGDLADHCLDRGREQLIAILNDLSTHADGMTTPGPTSRRDQAES
jgi:hypothetical protein